MLAPFSIDTYIPAFGQMMGDLDTNIQSLELTMSVYLFGYAIGQFGGGVVSDRYGRRGIGVTGLMLYTLSTVIIYYTDSINLIYLARFLQAIGGGVITVTAMAIVRDLYKGKELARRLSLISVFMLLAPLVAPILGTYLSLHFGWRSIFLFLIYFSILLNLVLIFVIPKTQKVKNKSNVVKIMKQIFSNRIAMKHFFIASFTFSALFCFVTDANFFYIQYYKKPIELFPVYISSNIILMMLLSLLNSKLLKFYHPSQILGWTLKFQLFIISVLILLFLNGFEEYFHFFFFGIILFIGANGLIYGNALGIAYDLFPTLSASAAAVNGLMRSGMGGLFSLLLAYMHGGTPITMFVFIGVASLLAVVTLFFKNKKIEKA